LRGSSRAAVINVVSSGSFLPTRQHNGDIYVEKANYNAAGIVWDIDPVA
jgi:hypothetical protein